MSVRALITELAGLSVNVFCRFIVDFRNLHGSFQSKESRDIASKLDIVPTLITHPLPANGMFCKRCGVAKMSKQLGVGHGSVPCRPLFSHVCKHYFCG